MTDKQDLLKGRLTVDSSEKLEESKKEGSTLPGDAVINYIQSKGYADLKEYAPHILDPANRSLLS